MTLAAGRSAPSPSGVCASAHGKFRIQAVNGPLTKRPLLLADRAALD